MERQDASRGDLSRMRRSMLRRWGLFSRGLHHHQVLELGTKIDGIKLDEPAPVVPPALADDSNVGDCRMV